MKEKTKVESLTLTSFLKLMDVSESERRGGERGVSRGEHEDNGNRESVRIIEERAREKERVGRRRG